MWKALALTLVLLSSSPLTAQDWSVGVGTGPFVFGDFMERTFRLQTPGGPSSSSTITLSAATRAGLAVDLERSFSDRFAVRLEGSFTRAPFNVRTNQEGTDIDAGELDVTTVMLPLVFRINPRGTFRFHVHGGPALALYRLEAIENVEGAEPAFEGTQQEWGYAFGGGAAWWVSERLAIEANLTDIVSSSPIDREDLPDVPGIEVKRPHNVHTMVGLRWKF
jgi:opacity protein-like surface antigen